MEEICYWDQKQIQVLKLGRIVKKLMQNHLVYYCQYRESREEPALGSCTQHNPVDQYLGDEEFLNPEVWNPDAVDGGERRYQLDIPQPAAWEFCQIC